MPLHTGCAILCTPDMQVQHLSATGSRIKELGGPLVQTAKITLLCCYSSSLSFSGSKSESPLTSFSTVMSCSSDCSSFSSSSSQFSWGKKKTNKKVWTFVSHTIFATSKWEKIWSNATYVRVFICNHLII